MWKSLSIIHKNAHQVKVSVGIKKAADGNRTRDLRLTKATLYRLSHSSLFIGAFYRSQEGTISEWGSFVNKNAQNIKIYFNGCSDCLDL